MIVVSNSSPLIALAAIDSLDVLQNLYGSIQIPDEVYNEVVVRGKSWHGATAVAHASWIVRQAVVNQKTVAQMVSNGLDRGESEAITLALERSASLLIVDERAARAIARQHGLAITGVIGVLIAAKDVGLVASIKPLLGELLAAGFYAGPQLIAQALSLAGE